jgi:hypothetical protein
MAHTTFRGAGGLQQEKWAQARLLRQQREANHVPLPTGPNGVPIIGQPPNPLGKVLTRSELSALPKVEHLVDGFISTPATVVLVGGYGVGKTFLAIGLGNSTGTGLPWLGRAVQRRRVLYVLGEGAYGLGDRMAAWEAAWNKRARVPDGDLTFIVQPRSLAEQPTWDAITNMALTGGYRFVILDTFSSLAPDADETKDAAMIMRRMSNLSTSILGTVMLVHHPGWSDSSRTRGGYQFEANADEVLVAQEISKGSDMFTVTRKKVKDGPSGQIFYLRRLSLEGSCVIEEVRPDDADVPMRERILAVLANMGAIGATGPQIMDELGVEKDHRSTFYYALRKLTEDGGPVGKTEIGNSTRYHLRPDQEDNE